METYIVVHFVVCIIAAVLNLLACFSAESKVTLGLRLFSLIVSTTWAVWGGILLWAK